MTTALPDVTVARARVVAPGSEARLESRLRADAALGAFPGLASPRGEILVIRSMRGRLGADGPASRTRFSRAAEQAVEELRASAARPGAGGGAEGAEGAPAVLFDSLEEALLLLSLDRVRRRERWYWRGLSASLELDSTAGPCRILTLRPREVPAILALARTRGVLPELVSALQRREARAALESLAAVHGMPGLVDSVSDRLEAWGQEGRSRAPRRPAAAPGTSGSRPPETGQALGPADGAGVGAGSGAMGAGKGGAWSGAAGPGDPGKDALAAAPGIGEDADPWVAALVAAGLALADRPGGAAPVLRAVHDALETLQEEAVGAVAGSSDPGASPPAEGRASVDVRDGRGEPKSFTPRNGRRRVRGDPSPEERSAPIPGAPGAPGPRRLARGGGRSRDPRVEAPGPGGLGGEAGGTTGRLRTEGAEGPSPTPRSPKTRPLEASPPAGASPSGQDFRDGALLDAGRGRLPDRGRHRTTRPGSWTETADSGRLAFQTALGGVFFLLSAVEALDLPRLGAGRRYVEARGGWALFFHLSRALARASAEGVERAGAGSAVDTLFADPIWPALEALAGDGAHRAPPAPWLRRAVRGVRLHLQAAIATTCIQSASDAQTLQRVLLRPASVELGRTHVDVRLSLEQADPVVRAAGLDLDPGWVAWLGRIVLYRYE